MAGTFLPSHTRHDAGVAKLEESLSEQLLLRSIDSGSVAEQDAFLAAQQVQVHADFQAQLQGRFEPYPLPPSALQGEPPAAPAQTEIPSPDSL